MKYIAGAIIVTTVLSGCHSTPTKPVTGPITTETSDNVAIYGEPYFGNLGGDSPLVLLFHQGGSNGRGEYASIAQWLNGEGFRAIAWDQRSGGATYGSDNRTVGTLQDDVAKGYCEAYPDLQAALAYVQSNDLAQDIIVWGSSYSGALVFHLAADNPGVVDGVIAFSPASGGPLKACRASQRASDIKVPMLVLRPTSEMERSSSQDQKIVLTSAGVEFEVIDNGIHGSSMLVDERTGADMSAARATVLNWLKRATND